MELKAWTLIFNLNSSNRRLMSWSAAINQVLELTLVEGDEVRVLRHALPRSETRRRFMTSSKSAACHQALPSDG